jgi:CHAT domain
MLKEIEEKAVKIKEKAVIPQPQPDETIHEEFGKMLYDAVFSGELGDYFKKRFNEVQDENCGFRISMLFGEDVPEISALPWEYLHDEEDFLITRRSILLSRLSPGIKKTELKPLDSILRMLVVISAPDDPRITPLNTEKEQEIILEALDKLQRDQKIKVDFTEDATFENVQGYLNEQNYHIVSNSRFEQKHMWKTVKFFNIS